MPACFASIINKGLFLSIMVLLVQGTGGRVHMLYWNASNPLLLGEECGRLAVNTNPEDQQYDQVYYTAKTQYRKFKTNILRKGIVRPKSPFPHSCVCERFI
jgi:hypothetical protein